MVLERFLASVIAAIALFRLSYRAKAVLGYNIVFKRGSLPGRYKAVMFVDNKNFKPVVANKSTMYMAKVWHMRLVD